MSRVKSVVFLWDEGADKRATQACERLQKLGIPAAFIRIARQPDNHSAEQLVAWVREAHELARLGHTQVNT